MYSHSSSCTWIDPCALSSHSFLEHFQVQVQRTPDASALEFEGRSVTYAELHSQSNRIANHLISLGYPAEARIGICLDRSLEAIEYMLGILKAGLAFVPLDPEFPQSRLEYIVAHAKIKLIFCDDRYRPLFSSVPQDSVRMEAPECISRKDADHEPQVVIQPESLAYVMYTSGSTGKPKGVQIEHRSLMTYCAADVELFQLRETDRTLQFSTLNFDVAIEEIFPPLLVGSTVVIRPRQRAQASIELSDLIERNSITALHIATAYWNEWVDLMAASNVTVPSCLRLVIVTGEKISVEHYRRWLQMCSHDVLWCNAYGPTETTVTCTAFIPDEKWEGTQMPIGKPLPGYEAYILDDRLLPVADGETGHLFIGGPALARGYLDRPDLTAKAFLDVRLDVDSVPKRLYRTGDLARWLPSGDIEFSGRVDHQMKIGSYRIEPGEIEVVLNQYPDIRESLIVCDEYEGQKYLVAYVVPTSLSEFSAESLHAFLRERLPVYMVPSRFALLESMPKTVNGKIDRAALPTGNDLRVLGSKQSDDRPTSDLEKCLVEVWKRVLNLPAIGIHDDFFHLGGSSLLVTRVIAQISSRLRVAVPVRDFFANPTVATLAIHLERLQGTSIPQSHGGQIAALRSRLPEIQSWNVCSAGSQLAVVHYPAVRNNCSLKHAVLFAQSYGHEYTLAHRNVQQLAVQLAQLGFDVVRFDYAGTGDSEGDSECLSIDRWRNDILCVISKIQNEKRDHKLSLVGVRLGANLLGGSSVSNVEHLIAWDPIDCGARYVETLKAMHATEAANLTRYLRVRSVSDEEMLGYVWPRSLQDEVRSLRWSYRSGVQARRYSRIQTQSAFAADDPTSHAWSIVPSLDTVYWDRLEYANQAFASPATSRAIIDLLTASEGR